MAPRPLSPALLWLAPACSLPPPLLLLSTALAVARRCDGDEGNGIDDGIGSDKHEHRRAPTHVPRRLLPVHTIHIGNVGSDRRDETVRLLHGRMPYHSCCQPSAPAPHQQRVLRPAHARAECRRARRQLLSHAFIRRVGICSTVAAAAAAAATTLATPCAPAAALVAPCVSVAADASPLLRATPTGAPASAPPSRPPVSSHACSPVTLSHPVAHAPAPR